MQTTAERTETAPGPAKNRSRRVVLQSALDANAYNKAFFYKLRDQVRAGGPFAIASVGTPLEILRAMDIPFICLQWWTAVVSAKRKAPEYLNRLKEWGYPDDQQQYFSITWSSWYDKSENAPWGGLPDPTIIVGDPRDDNHAKIYQNFANAVGCPFYAFERTCFNVPKINWWDMVRHNWEDLLETEQLDIHENESKGFIRFLEETTGHEFSETKFKRVLDLVNEHEEYYVKTRDLIAQTIPAPVGIADTFKSVMVPQWQRGTEWGRDAARKLYLEIKERVDGGAAVCPDERVRLAWFGTGLWFNVDFYDAFIDSHGAVFVYSFYLGIAADGYIRYGNENPLRTLSARYACFPQQLQQPPWSSEWIVKEAKFNSVDGVVTMAPVNYFVQRALETAGIPVLALDTHNADNRGWNEETMRKQVAEFIERRVNPKAKERLKERLNAQRRAK
jgi:hypothetical protein